MKPFDERLVRAALDELSGSAHDEHLAKLVADDDYRVTFEQLRLLQRDLSRLPAPLPTPALSDRILAAVRAERRPEIVMMTAMGHQFWRIATPALAAAMILIALALRGESASTTTAESATLNSWYHLSADPTETS